MYDVLRLLDNNTEELERYCRVSKGVVALSRDLGPDLGLRALAHGATLCVSIGASDEEILQAVESVWRGTAAS